MAAYYGSMNMRSATLARLVFFSAISFTSVMASGTEKQKPVAKSNPAYMVAEFVLKDADSIKPYREKADATIKKYGGQYLARGGNIEPKEGDAPLDRIIIVRFDSLAQAKLWYASPEYQAIIHFRHKSGTTRIYFVEGLPE